jgi:hypothetical protein
VLRVIINEGDDEAEAMEKAVAEHVACHPEDAGLTVGDFKWVMRIIVRWPLPSGQKPSETLETIEGEFEDRRWLRQGLRREDQRRSQQSTGVSPRCSSASTEGMC